ncbi:DUF6233 domain-containing protein [Streptomyces sp. DSM 44915]|uniref:DUF6233 domain-containing protein n=1 Tax=Streptomyces chisholmiae TaxID=3075540 RepID=A0ABU2K025_9ACTN|nr:DUF6233 domain-containing protein [Streptomyces sp. DSM 44915]MDT0270601.1 DUF6233 domain-containing protein [Streptomyces sp. DSM 44915]
MSELLPPDLPRLRVLETALRLALAEVQQAIQAAEEQEAARARWWISWQRRRPGVRPSGVLHRADCWWRGKADLSDERVRALLDEHGERIEMCPACQPRPPAPESPPPVSPG